MILIKRLMVCASMFRLRELSLHFMRSIGDGSLCVLVFVMMRSSARVLQCVARHANSHVVK